MKAVQNEYILDISDGACCLCQIKNVD